MSTSSSAIRETVLPRLITERLFYAVAMLVGFGLMYWGTMIFIPRAEYEKDQARTLAERTETNKRIDKKLDELSSDIKTLIRESRNEK